MEIDRPVICISNAYHYDDADGTDNHYHDDDTHHQPDDSSPSTLHIHRSTTTLPVLAVKILNLSTTISISISIIFHINSIIHSLVKFILTIRSLDNHQFNNKCHGWVQDVL